MSSNPLDEIVEEEDVLAMLGGAPPHETKKQRRKREAREREAATLRGPVGSAGYPVEAAPVALTADEYIVAKAGEIRAAGGTLASARGAKDGPFLASQTDINANLTKWMVSGMVRGSWHRLGDVPLRVTFAELVNHPTITTALRGGVTRYQFTPVHPVRGLLNVALQEHTLDPRVSEQIQRAMREAESAPPDPSYAPMETPLGSPFSGGDGGGGGGYPVAGDEDEEPADMSGQWPSTPMEQFDGTEPPPPLPSIDEWGNATIDSTGGHFEAGGSDAEDAFDAFGGGDGGGAGGFGDLGSGFGAAPAPEPYGYGPQPAGTPHAPYRPHDPVVGKVATAFQDAIQAPLESTFAANAVVQRNLAQVAIDTSAMHLQMAQSAARLVELSNHQIELNAAVMHRQELRAVEMDERRRAARIKEEEADIRIAMARENMRRSVPIGERLLEQQAAAGGAIDPALQAHVVFGQTHTAGTRLTNAVVGMIEKNLASLVGFGATAALGAAGFTGAPPRAITDTQAPPKPTPEEVAKGAKPSSQQQALADANPALVADLVDANGRVDVARVALQVQLADNADRLNTIIGITGLSLDKIPLSEDDREHALALVLGATANAPVPPEVGLPGPPRPLDADGSGGA